MLDGDYATDTAREGEETMQYKRLTSLAIAGVFAIGCGESTGVTVQDLVGDWNATQYQYTDNANPAQQVDVIGQGASFSLSVAADGSASTLFDDGQGGTSSDSGVLDPDGTVLTLAGTAFEANRSGDVLTLTDATNAYDFDDNGSDEPATLVIIMQRQ